LTGMFVKNVDCQYNSALTSCLQIQIFVLHAVSI
jgi:hypothetical protein